MRITTETMRYIFPLLCVPPPPAPPTLTQGPPPLPTPPIPDALMSSSSSKSFGYGDSIPLSDVSANLGEAHMVVDIPDVMISSNEE